MDINNNKDTLHPMMDDILQGKWQSYFDHTTEERATITLTALARGETRFVPMEFRVAPDTPLGAPHPLYDALALIDAIHQDKTIKAQYEAARADSVQLSALPDHERQAIMNKGEDANSRMFEQKIQQLQSRWIDRLTDGQDMVDVLYLVEVGNIKGLANIAVGYEMDYIRDIHHADITIHQVVARHDEYVEALQSFPADEIVMPAEASGTISMARDNGCHETYHFTVERDALGMLQMSGDKHFQEFARQVANGSLYTERDNKVCAFSYLTETIEFLAEREISQHIITPEPSRQVEDYPYEYFTRT